MKRILCFGDSNTWGAIPGSTQRHPEEVRWTGILARELGEEFRVIEEGYNGRTTVFYDPVEDRLSGIDYFRPCLDTQSPLDLIILMLGTNDLKPVFSVRGAAIAYGFNSYLNALATVPMAGTRPKVLLVSPIHVHPNYAKGALFADVFGPDAVERSRELAPAYAQFAEEHGLAYLDAAAFAEASPVDGVHMDAENHAKLAAGMLAKVREIFAG